MQKQLTKEELQQIPLKKLRLLDLSSPEYEILVNQVINSKLVETPINLKIKRSDVPDIKNPIDEEAWNKVILARIEAQKPIIIETPIEEVKEETVIIPTVVSVTAKPQFCDKCDSKGITHKKICPNFIDKSKKKDKNINQDISQTINQTTTNTTQ